MVEDLEEILARRAIALLGRIANAASTCRQSLVERQAHPRPGCMPERRRCDERKEAILRWLDEVGTAVDTIASDDDAASDASAGRKARP